MPVRTYLEAITDALREEMNRDERIFIMGEDVCAYGGSSGADGGKPYGHLARDIRFINNVFTRGTSGRCGNLGAVAGYDATRPGNLWQGNTWDDGTTMRP